MLNEPMTARQIADLVGGTVEGDGGVRVSGVAPIDAASPGDLTFAADAKHAARLADSKASAALVSADVAGPMTLIRVADVQAAVAAILGRIAEPEDLPPAGVHASAVIAPDAVLGEGAAVGPGAVVASGARVGARTVLCAGVSVGKGVSVGEDCVFFEGVVIRRGCEVGHRVRIGANSVIGTDGFGYYFADGAHHKIPHVGTVVIEDDVELGACACVDRGKFDATRVGAGTKIDNLVQVAHNVRIGRGCILVAQCGVAGSARLGDLAVIGGHAGIRDNISIGGQARVAAFTAVAADVPDGETVVGVPALPGREMLRIIKAWEKLPDLLKRVKELESRLKAIESPEDH